MLDITLFAVSFAGCMGDKPNDGFTSTASSTRTSARTDKELILDAILEDLVLAPEYEKTGHGYGTPGDKQFALVSNDSCGVAWPRDYQPSIPGYAVRRFKEGIDERDSNTNRLLGIRIDKFDLNQKEHGMLDAPIVVTIMNVGGCKNGGILGGCFIYYVPERVGDKWTVACVGSLDP
jgi:hypothetical protein